jgi:hypothetical protein
MKSLMREDCHALVVKRGEACGHIGTAVAGDPALAELARLLISFGAERAINPRPARPESRPLVTALLFKPRS